ncbi:MAG: plastocyanin/azurin family copper-binding protein [Dongiaceae bacterium]
MNRPILGLALVAGLAVLAAPVLAAAPATVHVDEWNKGDGSQGITITPAQIKAGKVTFKVTNTSKDTVHELLIVKTETPPEQFQAESDDPAKIDEGRLPGVKELPHDLKPGQSASLTMTVKPGHYVLFCNQTGHFQAGMHSVLTVVK